MGASCTQLMESGVILMYLAAKAGKFDGENEREKWKVREWLMWQMAGFGPMLGMEFTMQYQFGLTLVAR